MSGYDPRQERSQRYARRAGSAFPLSDLELAERRHYRLQDYWRQFYVLGPIAVAAIVSFVFGNDWRFFVVEIVASVSAFVLAAAVAAFLNTHFKMGAGLWLRLQVWSHGVNGGFVLLVGLSATMNATMPAIAGLGVALVGAIMIGWPWLYSHLRLRYPSDFERYLEARQSPVRGIME